MVSIDETLLQRIKLLHKALKKAALGVAGRETIYPVVPMDTYYSVMRPILFKYFKWSSLSRAADTVEARRFGYAMKLFKEAMKRTLEDERFFVDLLQRSSNTDDLTKGFLDRMAYNLRKLMMEEKRQGKPSDMVDRRIIRLLSLVEETGRSGRNLLLPPFIITPHPVTGKLRLHFLILPEHQQYFSEKTLKKGLTDYYGLPHLSYFDLEEIPFVVEREHLLRILLHPKSPQVLERVSGRHKPYEVLEALSQLRDPYYLLSRHEDLPYEVFNPRVLRYLSNYDAAKLVKIVEELARLRSRLSNVSTEGILKVVKLIEEAPHLATYLVHSNVAENADLLLLAKDNPTLLLAIKELVDHLHFHNPRSMRRLLEVGINTSDPEVFKLLALHPDVYKYYGVLASSNIPKEELEKILLFKERWKGLEEELLRKALETQVGRKLLTSSLSLEEKKKLLEDVSRLSEADIEVLELANRYGLEPEEVRVIRKYLGKQAEEFLKHHRDLVVATSGRKELITLLSYFREKGSPLSPTEIKAIRVLLQSLEDADPRVVIKIVGSLSRSELYQLTRLDPRIIKTFVRYVLSDREKFVEELREFLRTRHEVSKRIVVKPKGPKPEDEIVRLLEGEVRFFDGYRVYLTREFAKKLGVNEEVGLNDFIKALQKYLKKKYGLSKKDVRAVVRSLNIHDVLKRKVPNWISKKEVYHPIQELKEEEAYRLKSILDSMHRALEMGDVLIEEIDLEKGYIVFHVKRTTHHSKVYFDKTLAGFVNNLSGGLKYMRKGERVYIPLTFFKALSSHELLGTHDMVNHVLQRLGVG